MNRTAARWAAAIVIAGLGATIFSLRSPTTNEMRPEPKIGASAARVEPAAKDSSPREETPAPPSEAKPRGLTAAEKKARVEKIEHDYKEIMAKSAAEFAAAGTNFPGGLNAYLRQLALLEREKRNDLAAVIPDEIEAYEMEHTTAGRAVQQWLADTAASDEQRRQVFRLQRALDERFALTFDLSPAALLERELARQATQEQIRGVLGEATFPAWLRGEGTDFASLAVFVAQQSLPAETAFQVWRAKNEFTLRRLELAAQSGFTPEQSRAAHAALTRQTHARLTAILGPGPMQMAARDVFAWLPRE